MALFSGTMNFIANVPNGQFEYEQNGKKLKMDMFKVLLQDRESQEIHEFYTTAKNETLLSLIGLLKPMDKVTMVVALEYDRFKKRSKWVIKELHKE